MNDQAEHKLRERLLLAARVEGDRLVLADPVLLGALDGTRSLTTGERDALRQSPLTLRRFRQLSIERTRAAGDTWRASHGMLRAASNGALEALHTDDGHWSLHFAQHQAGWNLILVLDAGAPFAARLLREQPMLRVLDGGGAVILQGRLDADGEYECAWAFAETPHAWFQAHGATFTVEPAARD